MNTVYTVSAAADTLSVSVSTVRRLCVDFAGYLPDYQPTPGQTRTLSDADVRTLSAILTRLQARPGLTRSQLLRELSEPGSEPLIIPAELPARQPRNATDSPRTPLDVPAISDSPAPSANALQALPAIAADVARLHARIDALTAQERPPDSPGTARPQEWRFAVAITLSVVLLLAGVTVSAILRDSQAALLTSVLALIVLIAAIVWPTLRR